MRIWLGIAMLVVGVCVSPSKGEAQVSQFDRMFTGGTLRMDYYHEGSAEKDSFYLYRFIEKGCRWHGSRTNMEAPFNAGHYRVVVRNAANDSVVYSHCFSTLFDEYVNTEIGRTKEQRFEGSVLMPMPRESVRIEMQKRDTNQQFTDVLVAEFDPQQTKLGHVKRAANPTMVREKGEIDRAIDVAIVLQGFTNLQTKQLLQERGLIDSIVVEGEVFRIFADKVNIRVVSADVGVRSQVFGIERYMMTFDMFKLYDAIDKMPCDYVIIVVNDAGYGGGGIYNMYAVSSIHRLAPLIIQHELGHLVGDLADEYVDEDISYAEVYARGREPIEPNITNMVDFSSKWQAMVGEDNGKGGGKIGLYEGAGYSSKGVFRPAEHCLMRDYYPLCAVCKKRINEVFNSLVK